MNKKGFKTTIKLGLATAGVGAALLVGANKIEEVKEDLQPRVEVELNDEKEEVKESVRLVEDAALDWSVIDYATGYHIVDVDKLFDKFILKNRAAIGDDMPLNAAKSEIINFLGEKIYAVEIQNDGVLLSNLDGKDLLVTTNEENDYFGICRVTDNGFIDISGGKGAYHYANSNTYDEVNTFDKYCEDIVSNSDIQSIIYRREDAALLSFQLSSEGFIISTKNGGAKFNLTEEENNYLLQEFAKYKESNNIKEFIDNNEDVLNSYFNEISVADEELFNDVTANYVYLSNEKSKTLSKNK